MSELIYGRHAVQETLRAGRRRIFRLWLEERAQIKPGGIVEKIVAGADETGIPTRTIQGGLFEKLAHQGVNAQGVALEVGDYPYVAVDDCLDKAADESEAPLLLLLDHLQDPQNLGTLLRTADAMNVHGILIPERRSARVTPAVSNASAGAVEHLLVSQVTNLNRVIKGLKRQNIWVVGLDTTSESQPLSTADLTGGLAVVVGSESSGLSRLTKEKCDFTVHIPMLGQVASLNAAIAGSIVLYAARQARIR